MIRLIMLLGGIYMASRVIKTLLPGSSEGGENAARPEEAADADDLMVKDPCCEIYIPQREGIHLQRGGKDLYFCSTQCRDRYIALKEKT